MENIPLFPFLLCVLLVFLFRFCSVSCFFFLFLFCSVCVISCPLVDTFTIELFCRLHDDIWFASLRESNCLQSRSGESSISQTVTEK
jgi:hypothetical protein